MTQLENHKKCFVVLTFKIILPILTYDEVRKTLVGDVDARLDLENVEPDRDHLSLINCNPPCHFRV